jgi:hypothetical protein
MSRQHIPTSDTGCDESPKCVDCPLPVCKFEDLPAGITIQQEQRAPSVRRSDYGGSHRRLRPVALAESVPVRRLEFRGT